MITGATPYLSFNNQCEEALNFYAKALQGELNLMRVSDSPKEYQTPGDENKIMHAELKIGSTSVLASDAFGYPVSPGSNNSVCLNFSDVKEMEAAFNNMKAGGKVTMDLQDTFWGARFGMLTDKFGVNWMFNCDKK